MELAINNVMHCTFFWYEKANEKRELSGYNVHLMNAYNLFAEYPEEKKGLSKKSVG